MKIIDFFRDLLQNSEGARQAAAGAPAVGGAAYSAITLNSAVAYATLAYIALQAAYLLRKWWREEKEKGEKK
jgi:hypothetical protein